MNATKNIKMKKLKLTLLPMAFLLGILFFGCSEQKSSIQGGGMKTIHVGKPEFDSPINLSDFIKDVKIIPLEFNKKCILGKIQKIVVFQNDIYIQDGMNNEGVFKFDMTGKFLSIIGKKGKGPGEHVSLTDFSLDPINKHVFIFDRALGKLTEFSLPDNKFIRDMSMGFSPSAFEYKDSLYYLYQMHNSSPMNGDLIIKNSQDKLVAKYFKTTPLFMEFQHNNFHSLPEGLFFTTKYNDTIYKLNKEKLECAYYLDYGKFKLKPDLYKSLIDFKSDDFVVNQKNPFSAGVNNLYQVKNILYFTFLHGMYVSHAFYNIATDKTIVGIGVREDITYLSFRGTISQTGNSFIGVYEPSWIEEDIKSIGRQLSHRKIVNIEKANERIAWLKSYKQSGVENLNPFIILYNVK